MSSGSSSSISGPGPPPPDPYHPSPTSSTSPTPTGSPPSKRARLAGTSEAVSPVHHDPSMAIDSNTDSSEETSSAAAASSGLNPSYGLRNARSMDDPSQMGGDDVPPPKKWKGKGRAKVCPLLPENVWKRVYEMLFESCHQDWLAERPVTDVISPLLVCREFTAIATQILYSHPYINLGAIPKFIKSFKTHSKSHPDSRSTHFRDLTVRPSPTFITPGPHPTLHRQLRELLAIFGGNLRSLTLKDVLVSGTVEGQVLLDALKLVSPQKVRLEIRVWDLRVSPLGKELFAATRPGPYYSTQRKVDPGNDDTGTINTQRQLDAQRAIPINHTAWRDALHNGTEFDIPMSWLTQEDDVANLAQQQAVHQQQNVQAAQAAQAWMANNMALVGQQTNMNPTVGAMATLANIDTASSTSSDDGSAGDDIPGRPSSPSRPSNATASTNNLPHPNSTEAQFASALNQMSANLRASEEAHDAAQSLTHSAAAPSTTTGTLPWYRGPRIRGPSRRLDDSTSASSSLSTITPVDDTAATAPVPAQASTPTEQNIPGSQRAGGGAASAQTSPPASASNSNPASSATTLATVAQVPTTTSTPGTSSTDGNECASQALFPPSKRPEDHDRESNPRAWLERFDKQYELENPEPGFRWIPSVKPPMTAGTTTGSFFSPAGIKVEDKPAAETVTNGTAVPPAAETPPLGEMPDGGTAPSVDAPVKEEATNEPSSAAEVPDPAASTTMSSALSGLTGQSSSDTDHNDGEVPDPGVSDLLAEAQTEYEVSRQSYLAQQQQRRLEIDAMYWSTSTQAEGAADIDDAPLIGEINPFPRIRSVANDGPANPSPTISTVPPPRTGSQTPLMRFRSMQTGTMTGTRGVPTNAGGTTSAGASSSSLAALPAPNTSNPVGQAPAVNGAMARNPWSTFPHDLRRQLSNLFENEWASVQAFSFVALDPSAALIAQAPKLDFWTGVAVPRIRVHLPRGLNSLSVFKGVAEVRRERERKRRAAAIANGEIDEAADAQGDGTNEGQEGGAVRRSYTDHLVVGGDGHGGGLLHESNRLFEIEVNTKEEMDDDVWLYCGGQLPPQACRIQAGAHDWESVPIQFQEPSPPYYLPTMTYPNTPSPATSLFASPTFSWVDDSDGDGAISDMSLEPSSSAGGAGSAGTGAPRAGATYDAEAAKEQLRRRNERVEKGKGV